jgi:uncharacterized protein
VTPVFLDTVGPLALWDRSDQWHTDVEQAFADLQAAVAPLVTTTFVLLECGNAAARRPYRNSALRLWTRMDAVGALLRPTGDDVRAAWAAYEQRAAGAAGIVDHVSFVVMRRLNLTQAFTNDRHFRTAGFQILF